MHVDSSKLKRIQLKNRFQSVLLLLSMAAFVALISLWLFGTEFALIALILIIMLGVINPVFSPRFIMRAYGASEISSHQAQKLHFLNQKISQRAGLRQPPVLYYIPVGTMNAFATGAKKNAVIGLSDGLLRQLDLEELAGVLAHEISHIKHNDMRVMSLADTLGLLTRTLSMMGQIMLIFFLPAALLGLVSINLLAFVVLIFAPFGSALIQLALARNREFLADLSAAQLLGDPNPLIHALIKLDKQNCYWERFYRASADSTFLRTHPTTRDRVAQLKSVYEPLQWSPFKFTGLAHQDLLAAKKILPKRIGRYYWF